MEPLFNLIQKRTKNKISTNLQKLYTNILRSDIGGAFMLMFGYTPASDMIKRLSYYIRIFNMIISPTHCSAQEISEVLKIEEIINEIDEVELDRDHILNSIQLCQGKLPIERVKDVAVKILEGCGRWDLKEFLETSDHEDIFEDLKEQDEGNLFIFMEKNKLQGELIISNQYNPRSCPYEIYHRGRTGTIWDLATLLKNFLEISVGKSSAVHSLIDATFISIFQNSNRNISIIKTLIEGYFFWQKWQKIASLHF